MENVKSTKGLIKFSEKKAVMRPFNNEPGAIEVWSTLQSDGLDGSYFNHNGIRYYLASKTEAK
jgi:hypothetical protein